MDDIASRLARPLRDRFEIEDEIGRGGMATVFRGTDSRHGRPVAIKVLHPELANAIGPSRFQREIDIVAQLHHPHILTLIDSGEADGLLYYVMPFVVGESLRELLDRQGPMALDRTLSIVDQVGSALAYAHENGVVHRDVKPENILLTGDQAIVADFGIAYTGHEGTASKLTKTGIVVGTPAYMSPEQALGDQRVDGRSDVYGLGCVLFEMLAGRPPFEAETLQGLVMSHLLDEPPALSRVVPAVPEYVSRAASKAMAKASDERFRTARAMVETLRERRVVDRVRRKRIAVLPPRSVGAAEELDYVGQGLQESLIGRLDRGPVAVLARTSVQAAEDLGSVREIGRALEVDSVLESSILWAGERMRVEARLVDVESEEGLWTGSYDGRLEDVFELYSRVSESLSTEVLGVLAPKRRITGAAASVDPAAYERYMRGRIHQQAFTPEDLDQAERYYEAALAIDPEYAAPHAGMSLIWGSRGVLGLSSKEAQDKALHHARRSIELDPEWAEGHQALAQYLTWTRFDWEAAETSYVRAIALDPTEPQARNFYSHFLAMLHRIEESDEQILKSLEIDPLNPFTRMFRSIQLALTGRYGQAVEAFESVPENPLKSFALAWIRLNSGETEEGLRRYIEYFGMLGDSEVVQAMEPHRNDLKAAMIAGAEVLVERASSVFVKPNNIIYLYAWGGDVDRAMEWIEHAWTIRDHELAYFGTMGLNADLRADPRFKAFLKDRMELPHPDDMPTT